MLPSKFLSATWEEFFEVDMLPSKFLLATTEQLSRGGIMTKSERSISIIAAIDVLLLIITAVN